LIIGCSPWGPDAVISTAGRSLLFWNPYHFPDPLLNQG
jgi:hypothetical protein